MKNFGPFALVSLAFAAGCSASSQELSSSGPRDVNEPLHAASRIQAAEGDAPGFVHSIQRSKFHLGTSPQPAVEGSVTKLVGSEGVFATNSVTGASRALLNGTSAVLNRPPLTTDPEAHNARVVSYFTAAGLPADQIRDAQVLTHQKSLSSNSASSPIVPIFDGYTTVITRQVSGISVPDSFAAARFDADDEVVEEWVYWPAIPHVAIVEAQAIAAVHADPTSAASFLKKLPRAVQSASGGESTIRHSDFADESIFKAFGSFDVQVARD